MALFGAVVVYNPILQGKKEVKRHTDTFKHLKVCLRLHKEKQQYIDG